MKKSHILRSATAVLTSLSFLMSSLGLFPVAQALAQETAPTTKVESAEATPEPVNAKAEPVDAKAEPVEKMSDSSGAPVPTTGDGAIPTEEERVAAMTAFHAGESAFGEANFALAAEQFQAAYDTIPSPHAEYWIALCLDKIDRAHSNPEETLEAYEIFLSNSGADRVGEEQISFSKQRVKELLKLMPSTVTLVSNPSGATLVIDNETQSGVTPLTIELPAGEHAITFTREGYEDTVVELELEGGAKLEQQVELNELPKQAEAEPQPEAAEPESMVPAYVTLGIAGAGLITGTTFGILALTGKSKYNDTPTSSQADTVERNALIADMSLSVALTLGITSYILFKNAKKGRKEALAAIKKREQFIVAPFATRHSGGAAARLKF